MCYIVDETNRVRLLDSSDGCPCIIQKKEQYGTYLSLIPITEFVEGLTITGVMYPLYKKKVYQGNSLTVSNRIVERETIISLDKGKILIIESMD